jgi:hypothetical protein
MDQELLQALTMSSGGNKMTNANMPTVGKPISYT